MGDPKEFQSVSIWRHDSGYTVRGYYRGASHQIAKFETLQEAVDRAFATPRKQLRVALVPLKEEAEAFAEKAAKALGFGGAA